MECARNLYKNIYYENNSYHIILRQERLAETTDLREALFLRDLLIFNDGDISAIIEANLPPNPYEQIALINFPKIRKNGRIKGNIREDAKNIYFHNNYYEIWKTINGERNYFGRYKSEEEAAAIVEELKKEEWNKNRLKIIKEKIGVR